MYFKKKSFCFSLLLTAIPRSIRNAMINRAENAGRIGCQQVNDVDRLFDDVITISIHSFK
jgi:hypothetical protein